MLNQLALFFKNRKKLILISFIVIFVILLGIILIIVLNKPSEEEETSDTTTQDTTDSTTSQMPDKDITDLLSNTVTLVDLSKLPKDFNDYSSLKAYYVSTNGDDNNEGSLNNPFATISHALEIASDESAVFVREGTYKTNNLKITHSNFVLATYNSEEVTLTPEVINNEWDANEDLAFSIEGDLKNVIIDGFGIENFEASFIYGNTETQENIILKNINIKNATTGIENTYSTHSEYLVRGFLIKNVTMTDIAGIGLQCGDEYNNCAKDVLIQNVQIYGTESSKNDTGYDSCAMVKSDNVLVVNSIFTNAPGDGLDFKSTNVSVVNTTVVSPNRNGMKFWHEGEIINSIIYATGADAAVVFDSETKNSKFRIINSIVAQHLINLPTSDRYAYALTIGYDESKAYNIELINNIFYDMPGPLYINPESSVIIRNNIFYKFIHDNRFLVYGEDDFDNINELNAKDYASDNLYTDPLFVDPASSNWILPYESPARDSGTSKGEMPDFDINWIERPVGDGIDIGPYEN
jgi:hypothetical protein